MTCKKKNNAFCNNYIYWLYGLFFIIASALSCKNNSNNNADQAYFDAVFKKIDSSGLLAEHKLHAADMADLDAAFATGKKPSPDALANKYIRKALYYAGAKADFKAGILYTDSAINLLKKFTDDEQLAALYTRTLFDKGTFHFKIKNYDDAIHCFTMAMLNLSDTGKNSCQLTKYYYSSMANILYAQQKYLLAAEFFRKEYTAPGDCIQEPSGLFWDVQENMDNTGICYFKGGLTDSAIYYYNATLRYIDETEKQFSKLNITNTSNAEFEFARAVVYSNQADVLCQQKDMAGAEKLYLKSIEGSKPFIDTSFTEPLQLSLATLYINTNQVKKAGEILFGLKKCIDSSEVSNTAADFHRLFSDYYLKKKQPLTAYHYLLRSYIITDSLQKRDKKFNDTDVQQELENREQQASNEALKKDNEIKNSYLLIVVISTAMIFIIMLIIWTSLERKSGYVKKLTALNAAISAKNNDLQKTLFSLEQSHKENNRIVRIVAHDLKNPVNAIRTLVFPLLKKEQTSSNKESLQLIQDTCVESITLINDLLNKKRNLLYTGKELVDMGRLIEHCTELFQIKAGEKKQYIKLQVEYPVIMLHRQKMLRVVSNIVNNAIKFSPENTEIFVRLEKKEDSVLLSVHDNGIGIPSRLKDKIFAVDQVILREGTAGEESYGLGLVISKKIIEEHEGKFWFESEAGKGSVFYVELPYSAN